MNSAHSGQFGSRELGSMRAIRRDVIPDMKTDDMVRTEVDTDETVAIAVLMGFSTRPADDISGLELYSQCQAAAFALTPHDLPHGRWAREGYAFEQAGTITVRRAAAPALCQAPTRWNSPTVVAPKHPALPTTSSKARRAVPKGKGS